MAVKADPSSAIDQQYFENRLIACMSARNCYLTVCWAGATASGVVNRRLAGLYEGAAELIDMNSQLYNYPCPRPLACATERMSSRETPVVVLKNVTVCATIGGSHVSTLKSMHDEAKLHVEMGFDQEAVAKLPMDFRKAKIASAVAQIKKHTATLQSIGPAGSPSSRIIGQLHLR